MPCESLDGLEGTEQRAKQPKKENEEKVMTSVDAAEAHGSALEELQEEKKGCTCSNIGTHISPFPPPAPNLSHSLPLSLSLSLDLHPRGPFQ